MKIRGEVGTAARQISARLRLEPYDLLDDDAPHDGDVPVGPLQGPGELESPTPTALRREGEGQGEGEESSGRLRRLTGVRVVVL